MINQTITQILILNKNEYVETQLFELWFPQKDSEWFYIEKYFEGEDIKIWEMIYIKLKSNWVIKYMNKNWNVLLDTKWKYISSITSIIKDKNYIIINSINFIGTKQVIQLFDDWALLKIEWEEIIKQEISINNLNLEEWSLTEWEYITDFYIRKDKSKNYDNILLMQNYQLKELNLKEFLEIINKWRKIEIEEYCENIEITQIDRIIKIWWEIFCEITTIEKIQSWEEDEDWDEYLNDEIKSILITRDWDLIKSQNNKWDNIDINSIITVVNIFGKKFISFEDSENVIWWLIDKEWDIIKLKYNNLEEKLVYFDKIENYITINNKLKNDLYQINGNQIFTLSENEIRKQLEKYVSF